MNKKIQHFKSCVHPSHAPTVSSPKMVLLYGNNLINDQAYVTIIGFFLTKSTYDVLKRIPRHESLLKQQWYYPSHSMCLHKSVLINTNNRWGNFMK